VFEENKLAISKMSNHFKKKDWTKITGTKQSPNIVGL
jgi:hypothetical protein